MQRAASDKAGVRPFTGILLAAGRGTRFDASGARDKLLQPLAGGDIVAVTAARNLLSVLPEVLAVVRPGAEQLASQLRDAGCETFICPVAAQGMAASLVHGLSGSMHAKGWLIALADMPYVQPMTIRSLVSAIDEGAQIAVPTYQGRRGNPVAFSRSRLQDLLALRGDQGARRLLHLFPVKEIATNDPGICRDIDCVEDLRGDPSAPN